MDCSQDAFFRNPSLPAGKHPISLLVKRKFQPPASGDDPETKKQSMSHDFFEKCMNSFPLDVAVIRQEPVCHLASLSELSRAFQKVTGYHLRFFKPNAGTNAEAIDCVATFPVTSGEQNTSCMMGLVRNYPAVSLIPERDVEYLARALADMISEAHQWQVALRQREAELAANV